VGEVEEIKKFTCRPIGVTLFLLIIIASAIALQGCSKKPVVTSHAGSDHDLEREKETPSPAFFGEKIEPIQLGSEEFSKAVGWLTEDSILYITNQGESSSLYSHNLVTGNSNILYKSEIPIVTAELSPDKEMVLIHRAVSNKGFLNIINIDGTEVYSGNIDSYELSFEWNPYNQDLVAISAFTEDWDFKTFLLDISKKEMNETAFPEPFIRWVSDHEIGYQEWNDDSMSLLAPLKVMSIRTMKSELALDEIYVFDAFGKYLMAVTINDENERQRAQYTLYEEQLSPEASFEVPLLTSFSGWLVPFYDLIENKKDFLYLRALYEGEADVYEEGFELVRYNLESRQDDVILTGLNNESISCSPAGNLCLYGFQLEKVININSRGIIELIE
jgi:hypothetical protein